LVPTAFRTFSPPLYAEPHPLSEKTPIAVFTKLVRGEKNWLMRYPALPRISTASNPDSTGPKSRSTNFALNAREFHESSAPLVFLRSAWISLLRRKRLSTSNSCRVGVSEPALIRAACANLQDRNQKWTALVNTLQTGKVLFKMIDPPIPRPYTHNHRWGTALPMIRPAPTTWLHIQHRTSQADL